MLSLCFSYVSTENRPAYGEMLLGFPDEVIDRLSEDLGLTDMEDVNLYVQQSRLRDFCGRVLARCKNRRVTPVELFGNHENIGTAALEEMEDADRLERKRKRQEILAAGKKAVAEWQAEL